MQAGDILTAKEADYIEALESLWGELGHTLDGLTEDALPRGFKVVIARLADVAYAQSERLFDDNEDIETSGREP